jgi:hypothetical protein
VPLPPKAQNAPSNDIVVDSMDLTPVTCPLVPTSWATSQGASEVKAASQLRPLELILTLLQKIQTFLKSKLMLIILGSKPPRAFKAAAHGSDDWMIVIVPPEQEPAVVVALVT